MKIIGITGGVGAGKTTVINEIKKLCNARFIIADELAKELQLPGKACYEKIVNLLGEDILSAGKNSAIDNKKMAGKIFSNNGYLSAVNEIIHPAVKEYILDFIENEKNIKKSDYIFIEAALLIEDGYDEICDQMWYIYADEQIRIDRLRKSRGYSLEKCHSIMKSQNSDAVFRRYCKFVINNNGDLEETISDIKRALEG